MHSRIPLSIFSGCLEDQGSAKTEGGNRAATLQSVDTVFGERTDCLWSPVALEPEKVTTMKAVSLAHDVTDVHAWIWDTGACVDVAGEVVGSPYPRRDFLRLATGGA